MGQVKPHNMKAISTLANEPVNMSSRIQLMIAMDIAGSSGKDMESALGMSGTRISAIRNSPLFMSRRKRKWRELQDRVIDNKVDGIVSGDPVESKIKALAIKAIEAQEKMLDGAGSEFVRNSISNSILDRAGYKAHTEKTKITVEVTDKMADRFERVMKMAQSGDSSSKVSITTEREE